MKINPYNLKKLELQIYHSGHCKHRMPYDQHPNCFINEVLHNSKKYRTGILDIETFGFEFKADMGVILSYHIKDYHKRKYYASKVTQEEIRSKNLDMELTKRLIKDMKKFERLITYFGSRFDIPYIRTRCLRWNIDFPKYKHIEHVDVYYMVKYKLKLKRNSLENACKLMGMSTKNHIEFETWIRALTGNEKAIDKVFKHNKYDVNDLEKLYDKLVDFSRKTKRSI